MLSFHCRDPWPFCLFWAPDKSPPLLYFIADHCLPRFHSNSYGTYQVFYETLFLIKSKRRGLYSILHFQSSYCHVVLFSRSSFSKQCVHVHWVSGCRTHRSHIFSGRVPWRGALGWVLSLTQLCRRFTTRVMVTRLTTKFHCEMYLTPSLGSVQQGLINVRLMVVSPSTIKYLPDRYLLLSLFKQWH